MLVLSVFLGSTRYGREDDSSVTSIDIEFFFLNTYFLKVPGKRECLDFKYYSVQDQWP